MVAPGAFPLVKLGILAVRQVAKPLANMIKTRAKKSPFFRDYICMPPAQFYHWMDVNIKMRMLNLGKPREVRKLDQNAAIDLGADLLGETILFIVASVGLTYEFLRQSNNAAIAAAELEDKWQTIDDRLLELENLTTKQAADIKDLSQLVHAKGHRDGTKNTLSSHNQTSDSKDGGLISKAIEEAKGKLTSKKQ